MLQDVIRTMYNPKFIAELFRGQDVYSMQSTRQIFDKLAHSSIMRLNESSMDKARPPARPQSLRLLPQTPVPATGGGGGGGGGAPPHTPPSPLVPRGILLRPTTPRAAPHLVCRRSSLTS